MLKEVFIDIISSSVEYHFSLKHNINILLGDSATGKSTIPRLLSIIDSNGEATSGITINSSIPIIELTKRWFDIEKTKENNNLCIYIIDEDRQFIKTNEFSSFIKKSGCYFLIITGEEDIIDEPIDIEAIYHLREKVQGEKVINTLESHYTGLVSKNYDGYDLFTEDTKSGKHLCKELGYPVKKGLGGNGNVKLFLSSIKNERVSLFTDLFALGQVMPFVQESMKYNEINLLDCKSTEYILLKNSDLYRSLDLSELVWDFKKYRSLEKVYTHLLKVATKRVFGKQYNKGEDIIKLIDNNVKKEIKRIFEGEETKSVQSKKLADLL